MDKNIVEHWQSLDSPTEHEFTLDVPDTSVASFARGASIEVPGVGEGSVLLAERLWRGPWDLEPGRVAVRVRVVF